MMRLLLALALCVLSVGARAQGGMQPGPGTPAATASPTWTIVAIASCRFTSPSSGCTTSPIVATGANLFVAELLADGPSTGTLTITDSSTNSWTIVGTGSGDSLEEYYVVSPTVTASHTFTANGTNSFSTLFVLAIKDNSGSPTYGGTASSACTIASTTVQPGSLTPPSNHWLLVTGVNYNSGTAATLSLDSGFTIDQQVTQNAGNAFGGGIGHLEQLVAAAVNPTWTGSTTPTGACAAMLEFFP